MDKRSVKNTSKYRKDLQDGEEPSIGLDSIVKIEMVEKAEEDSVAQSVFTSRIVEEI